MNKMLTEWQKIKEYGEKINEETRAKIKMSNKTLKNIEFLELIKKVILESAFIQMLVKIVSFELFIGDQIALLILFGVRNVESPKHTSSVSCKIMFGNEDSTFINTES